MDFIHYYVDQQEKIIMLVILARNYQDTSEIAVKEIDSNNNVLILIDFIETSEEENYDLFEHKDVSV